MQWVRKGDGKTSPELHRLVVLLLVLPAVSSSTVRAQAPASPAICNLQNRAAVSRVGPTGPKKT